MRRTRTVYAINRYYSPETGRFTTHDPLTEIDRPERMNQPQGLNLYPYVMGGPTRYTDPDGLKWVYRPSSNGKGTFFETQDVNYTADPSDRDVNPETVYDVDESAPAEYHPGARVRINPNVSGSAAFTPVPDNDVIGEPQPIVPIETAVGGSIGEPSASPSITVESGSVSAPVYVEETWGFAIRNFASGLNPFDSMAMWAGEQYGIAEAAIGSVVSIPGEAVFWGRITFWHQFARGTGQIPELVMWENDPEAVKQLAERGVAFDRWKRDLATGLANPGAVLDAAAQVGPFGTGRAVGQGEFVAISTMAPFAKVPTARPGPPTVLLDSNVTTGLKVDSTLAGRIHPGEQPMVSYVAIPELRNAVVHSNLKGVPRAVFDLPTVMQRPSLNLRINLRGLLPDRPGRFGDGIIGAQALEFRFPLVTNDKALKAAVNAMGGETR